VWSGYATSPKLPTGAWHCLLIIVYQCNMARSAVVVPATPGGRNSVSNFVAGRLFQPLHRKLFRLSLAARFGGGSGHGGGASGGNGEGGDGGGDGGAGEGPSLQPAPPLEESQLSDQVSDRRSLR